MGRSLNSHERRAFSLIARAISKLELDLSGATVLTEIGSNNYLFTPFIALMAGAKKVNAWTRDTSFCNSAEITERSAAFLKFTGIEEQRLNLRINEFCTDDILEADVITNSGFLRPINAEFLSHTKPGVVIPLMYEAWEVRKEDLDIEACGQLKIKVAGTWENHPDIAVFSGIGPLALKLCQEAGYEVYQNTIIIWSDDHFGEEAEKSFLALGASRVVRTTNEEVLYHHIEQADLIFIADYDEKRPFTGTGGIWNLDLIKQRNPSVGIVHLYGDVDNELMKKEGFNVFPDQRGHSSRMTRTLGHLGLIPIINLQVAGFKVAQHLKSGTESKLVQKII